MATENDTTNKGRSIQKIPVWFFILCGLLFLGLVSFIFIKPNYSIFIPIVFLVVIFIYVILVMLLKPDLSFNLWFSSLMSILLLLVMSYVCLHILLDKQGHRKKIDNNRKYGYGYEYMSINTNQLQEINKLYADTAINRLPLLTTDSIPVKRNFVKRDTPAYQKVIMYLNNQYNDKIDTTQLKEIVEYLSYCTSIEAAGFLTTLHIRVKSYFWLTGPEVYFEVLFWSVFGVICSLLFRLGIIWKNATTDPSNPQSEYDPDEVPSQAAKIFYAPICTLVLIFGYSYIQDKEMVDISSSKGIIVISFIAGFYSQRMMAFLDRLKDLLLPNSGAADLPQQKNIIKEFTVKLKPEDAVLEKIRSTGMGDAEVTLNNGDVINAKKQGDDPAFNFVVKNLKPGEYTIKVNWKGKIENEEVKLSGEKKVTVNLSDYSTEIPVLKS